MEKKSLKNTKTRENLMKAFAGESMARMRYSMFATVAEKEGYKIISEVFKDTSNNEKEHAEVYFKFLDHDDVRITDISYPSCYGTTLENLLCAAKYEKEEHTTIYPEFAQIAKEEGFEEIAEAFSNIAQVEESHSKRYSKLADMLENKTLFKSNKKIKWECSNCGYNQVSEEAPTECDVCHKKQGYFKREET